MVFQGFSLLAMVLASVGVIAYHFYSNREAYFYETPPDVNYPVPGEGSRARRRRLKRSDAICSICMETGVSFDTLPCSHVFHPKCLAAWLKVNRSCPNCRCMLEIAH